MEIVIAIEKNAKGTNRKYSKQYIFILRYILSYICRYIYINIQQIYGKIFTLTSNEMPVKTIMRQDVMPIILVSFFFLTKYLNSSRSPFCVCMEQTHNEFYIQGCLLQGERLSDLLPNLSLDRNDCQERSAIIA